MRFSQACFVTAILCYTLGNPNNAHIPWVMDFLGVTKDYADRIFTAAGDELSQVVQNQDYIDLQQDNDTAVGGGGSSDTATATDTVVEAEPGDDNATGLGMEFAVGAYSFVRPDIDMTEEEAILLVQEKLPTVSYILVR